MATVYIAKKGRKSRGKGKAKGRSKGKKGKKKGKLREKERERKVQEKERAQINPNNSNNTSKPVLDNSCITLMHYSPK